MSLFENQFSDFLGGGYSSAVANGTVALHLALKALNISEGDEVIVPAVSWMTTYSPLIQLGLVPKIVDIEKETLKISIVSIKNAINDKT